MRFFCLSRSDLSRSTNSFIKRLVANFVDVNKIRVCISILQKHAFRTIRDQNLKPIVQKSVYMKNREGETWCIIVKNAILLIIHPFYFLIIVKNGVLLKSMFLLKVFRNINKKLWYNASRFQYRIDP